jgi:hypothetical protein
MSHAGELGAKLLTRDEARRTAGNIAKLRLRGLSKPSRIQPPPIATA